MTMNAAGNRRATSAERSRSSALGLGRVSSEPDVPAHEQHDGDGERHRREHGEVLAKGKQGHPGDDGERSEREPIEHETRRDGAEARRRGLSLEIHRAPPAAAR